MNRTHSRVLAGLTSGILRRGWGPAGFVVLLTAVLALTGNVQAAPVFAGTDVEMYLKQNTFPGGLNEQKIYLNSEQNVKQVKGQVGSQTGSPTVTFTSTSLLDAANGFSTIKGYQNAIYHDLTIEVPGYQFEDLIFGVILNDGVTGPTQPTSLEVTAYNGATELGTYNGWTSQTAWVPGFNDILVLAINGNSMTKVVLESPLGFLSIVGAVPLDGFDQTKEFQISGLDPIQTPTPATLWLLGPGLIGMGWLSRRWRRKAA